MTEKYLLCVAHRSEGQWEAICLDFDLVAQGVSLEEVREQLNGMIASYIKDAFEQPEPVRSRLLNRKVPFFTRLAWLWPFIMPSFFGSNSDKNSTVGFDVECHA